jgi:hypothetical protein
MRWPSHCKPLLWADPPTKNQRNVRQLLSEAEPRRLERARKLEVAWDERLAHQVNDLPPFREVFGEVHARVQKWEEAILSPSRPASLSGPSQAERSR